MTIFLTKSHPIINRIALFILMLLTLSMAGAQSFQNDMVHGFVKPGFEPVYEEFLRNFESGKETGAALSVYYKGEKVVDLWGGYAHKKNKQKWDENTLVLLFSATKGIASISLAKLHSEGKIDLNEIPLFCENYMNDPG